MGKSDLATTITTTLMSKVGWGMVTLDTLARYVGPQRPPADGHGDAIMVVGAALAAYSAVTGLKPTLRLTGRVARAIGTPARRAYYRLDDWLAHYCGFD